MFSEDREHCDLGGQGEFDLLTLRSDLFDFGNVGCNLRVTVSQCANDPLRSTVDVVVTSLDGTLLGHLFTPIVLGQPSDQKIIP